jgi:muramoyltetrapeptide carboxypeptidase
MRTRPARLNAGDRVVLVAPAGPVPRELLDKGVAVLEGWGLRVEIADHVLDRHPELPYLAGRDEHRAADLQRAWCDPDVAAVVCARGGYGSMRMLDLLDWDAMAAAGPKVFTGSSDITALHEAIGARFDLVTLFAPMIATMGFDDAAAEHLRATLFEPETVQRIAGPDSRPVNDGVASGIVVGGNLSLLASCVGAEDAVVPPDSSIVLLEEVNEEPYQIDRMLTQLMRAGWFTGVAGIALGSWTDCGEPDRVADVITDLLTGLGLPLVADLGFGHLPGQLTIPLGVHARLDADLGALTLTEPALR